MEPPGRGVATGQWPRDGEGEKQKVVKRVGVVKKLRGGLPKRRGYTI